MNEPHASPVSSTSQTGAQLSTHVRVKPLPSVRATVDQDGGVLLDTATGVCFGLNAFGARLWRAIESGDDLEDLVANEHTRYGSVSRETIAADVRRFVAELRNRALISAEGG